MLAKPSAVGTALLPGRPANSVPKHSNDPNPDPSLASQAPTVSPGSVTHVLTWVSKQIEHSTAPQVIAIEGGHFDSVLGADGFSQNSLRCSLQIGRELIRRFGRGLRVVYSTLIDDLGLDCDNKTCSMVSGPHPHSEQSLPPALETIFQADRLVKRERVILDTERHSRNRGLKRLKRLLDNKSDRVEGIVTIEETGNAITCNMRTDDGMTIEIASRVEKRWTIKCPLIMASHYADLVATIERRFGREYSVAIIDFSEVSDRGKVTRGSELALRALIPAEPGTGRRSILNVFWGDALGELVLVDSFQSADWR
jgi:hypothetical protein